MWLDVVRSKKTLWKLLISLKILKNIMKWVHTYLMEFYLWGLLAQEKQCLQELLLVKLMSSIFIVLAQNL